MVVFVVDPTEQYPLDDQEKLLRMVEKEDHDVVLYLSKTDIIPAKMTKEYSERFPGILVSPKEVRAAVIGKFTEWLN
jgi:GTP1/Obg family GTP-binding protein